MVENIEVNAIISNCGSYRYRLERRIGAGSRTCLFVMLNPSKADATIDDPTITRCITYARAWGYDKLVVGNLFAFRTKYPTELKVAADPVGPENTKHLSKMFREADIVIAAWGNHGDHRGRAQEFREYTAKNGIDLHYLKLTKQGHPSHPGRLAAALQPKRWS